MKERIYNQQNLTRKFRQLLVLFALLLLPQWTWAEDISYLEFDQTKGAFFENHCSATDVEAIASNTYKLINGKTYIVNNNIYLIITDYQYLGFCSNVPLEFSISERSSGK